MCKKKDNQQRRRNSHKTCSINSQEENHRGVEPTVEKVETEKEPKIKWPKANDKASYETFGAAVTKMEVQLGSTINCFINLIYMQAKERFNVEEKRTY